MKRFLLIAAGTVGGLGAVLSVTPPQLGATDLGLGLDMGTLPTAEVSTPTTVATSSPAKPTQSATKSSAPTKKPTSTTTNTTAATPTATQTQSAAPTVEPAPTKTATSTPTPVKTATPPPAPTVNSINGTFTGPVVNVSYGNVQVQITVTDGKITDAQALIAPTGKNDKYTRMALPKLKQQTLAAQSTNIQGASGASYTTYGWRKSLQGAMAKAGL